MNKFAVFAKLEPNHASGISLSSTIVVVVVDASPCRMFWDRVNALHYQKWNVCAQLTWDKVALCVSTGNQQLELEATSTVVQKATCFMWNASRKA
jgi:hypothetical protein